MSKPPERVFIDDRVAPTLPQEAHETPAPEHAIAYVRQDIAERAAQEAIDTIMPPEFIIQICNSYDQDEGNGASTLIALTNMGRVFRQQYDRKQEECYWDLMDWPLDQNSA